MSKGSWRRPTGPDFDKNYCLTFPNARGCVAARAQERLDQEKSERAARAEQVMQRSTSRFIALSLDELRALVFETSVAYADTIKPYCDECETGASVQEAEWARAAALKAGLERLGFEREAEMIGGAA